MLDASAGAAEVEQANIQARAPERRGTRQWGRAALGDAPDVRPWPSYPPAEGALAPGPLAVAFLAPGSAESRGTA